MTDTGPKVLVIRGDLTSSSGYAKASRLYCEYLETNYDAVLGVELFSKPDKGLAVPAPQWKYPVLDDKAVVRLIDSGATVHVHTIAKPEKYRKFSGARNTATFFWETDRIRDYVWVDQINETLDELWMPARFLCDMMTRSGVTVPVAYAPTPTPGVLGAGVSGPADEARAFSVLLTPATAEPDVSVSLAVVRATTSILFGTIGTDIPRKGLAVLFREWAHLVAENSELADARLVVKTSSIDVTKTTQDVLDGVSALARDVAGSAAESIYLVADRLSDGQIGALHAAYDVFVTTSFGEGFGLGVFESLEHGVPVLCPRHTSFAELLPEDYPYFLEADYQNVGLADPADVYPISASWGIPREGSLSSAAQRWLSDRSVVPEVVEAARSYQSSVTMAALKEIS